MSRLYPIKARSIRRNKYNAITCKCNQGHIHDSRGEAGYCNQLEILRKTGEINRYDIQQLYPLTVNGKTVCHHRIDFLVYTKNGPEIHEFKGIATPLWNLKRKLFEAIYPDIPYYVVKN